MPGRHPSWTPAPAPPPRMPPSGMPLPPSPPFPAPYTPLPAGVPVGTVVAFAGQIRGQAASATAVTATEPFGWVSCDGRQLHRAMYHELFAVIGYLYSRAGESPGALYRVPDLQGYFLRGVDPTGKVDPDNAERKTPAGTPASPPFVGSTQGCALQLHEHTYLEPKIAGTTPGEGSPVNLITTAEQPTKAVVAERGGEAPLTSAKETRAVNVGVHYLIKATDGAFPWTAPLGGAFAR